jgi:hypothetical protein
MFYILQQNYVDRSCIFFKPVNHIPFHDLVVSGASIASTLQMCVFTVLLLLMVGN